MKKRGIILSVIAVVILVGALVYLYVSNVRTDFPQAPDKVYCYEADYACRAILKQNINYCENSIFVNEDSKSTIRVDVEKIEDMCRVKYKVEISSVDEFKALSMQCEIPADKANLLVDSWNIVGLTYCEGNMKDKASTVLREIFMR